MNTPIVNYIKFGSFLMILLRESWHQIERVSISNENFEVVNSVLTSITIQCFGDGFKCLKYFSTIGKTFYIFEHFLIMECFTKFFSWIHKLKVIFFSHGHKLGIKLTIVIRNGKIVWQVVWIEYYLRLDLSSRRY